MTLDDVGGRLPWGSFANFLDHLPPTSAYQRELAREAGDDEMLMWVDGSLVAPLLANVCDEIAAFAWQHACANRGNHPKPPRPKPMRTPWGAKRNERQIGSGAIPISEFDAWWEQAAAQDDTSGGDAWQEEAT